MKTTFAKIKKIEKKFTYLHFFSMAIDNLQNLGKVVVGNRLCRLFTQPADPAMKI
jgi:hypothetical protein